MAAGAFGSNEQDNGLKRHAGLGFDSKGGRPFGGHARRGSDPF